MTVSSAAVDTGTGLANPLGLDGFEFIEFCAPQKGGGGGHLCGDGFVLRGPSSLQGCRALAAGRNQFRAQLRAQPRRPPISRPSMGPPCAAWGFV